MIYVFLASGFEEIEAVTAIDILRRCALEVTTVSVCESRSVRGAHGIYALADCLIGESDFADAAAVVLPGGMPGTENLAANEKLKEIISRAADGGAVIAAVCAAPLVLGRMGLLSGRRACCFPGFEEELCGAEVTRERTVTDGRIITSRGAGTAHDFAAAIAAALGCREKAERVISSMLYDAH